MVSASRYKRLLADLPSAETGGDRRDQEEQSLHVASSWLTLAESPLPKSWSPTTAVKRKD